MIILLPYRSQSRQSRRSQWRNLFLRQIFTVVTGLIFFLFFFLQTEANILSLVSDANATARPIFLKCLFEKKKKNKRGDKNLKAISRVPQCKLINDIWCQTPLFHFVAWRNYRAYNYVIKEKRKAHLLCKIFSTLVTTALKRKQIIAF